MTELTENLLLKLEEKIMLLLTESEDMRAEIQRLKDETIALKQEKATNTGKLEDLVSLLDSVGVCDDEMMSESEPLEMVRPAVAQA